jgi:hypothetical protein
MATSSRKWSKCLSTPEFEHLAKIGGIILCVADTSDDVTVAHSEQNIRHSSQIAFTLRTPIAPRPHQVGTMPTRAVKGFATTSLPSRTFSGSAANARGAGPSITAAASRGL